MTDAPSGRWSDLLPRVLSAVAMALVGGLELWLGGRFFHIFVGLIVALMMWELVRMISPARRQMALGCAALAGLLVAALPEGALAFGSLGMVIIAACVGLGLGAASGEKQKMGMAYGALILVGGLTLILLRDDLGLGWMLWLVLLVIASDVAGYFAGKTFGGPKFWPAISPKKTWSGTIAGWIGAALVGAVFGLGSGMMAWVIVLSVLLAFAAQLGDIAESAIKRRTGVKDSSALIPGHGGVLDRFDGLLGASVALLLIALVTGVPEGLL